jgi:hypothetical protein
VCRYQMKCCASSCPSEMSPSEPGTSCHQSCSSSCLDYSLTPVTCRYSGALQLVLLGSNATI